ncbi:unnamed protein product, partial [Closterium sp. Naga37s-1]
PPSQRLTSAKTLLDKASCWKMSRLNLECRRLIQEFERDMKDQEAKNSPEVNKLLQEKKRNLVKDLNVFVTLKKTYQSAIQEGQKVKLSEDGRTAEVVGAPRLAS